MDGITLDRLIGELRGRVLGGHVRRVRSAGPTALALELGRELLRLDAGRGTAGLYLLERGPARALERGEEAAGGGTRHALLLFRKHLSGARLTGLARIPGERALLLELPPARLCLRLSGGRPALTLAVEGEALATLGGAPAWPPPEPAPSREWDRVDAGALAEAARHGEQGGRGRAAAVLAACPPLGGLLARELDGSSEALAGLRARLARPRPTLLLPARLSDCHDADLAPAGAVALAPVPPAETRAGVVLHPPSWIRAAAWFLEARLRGQRFERRRREALEAAGRELRRLERLDAHLTGDLSRSPDPAALRRRAEALLASPPPASPAGSEIQVADPYDPSARIRVALDPRLTLPANADRLFAKARRMEQARGRIEARLRDTRRGLEAARALEAAVREARDLAELPEPAPQGPRRRARRGEAGLRCFLSSRGLSLLVGRGARANHHLTFELAGPEDLWFHARGVPGAHVILRDPEGRAEAADRREAAELAAFFSALSGEGWVDVHVARRKHLRAVRGAPGRVRIAHSETLRVAPRDPEGRLRRR